MARTFSLDGADVTAPSSRETDWASVFHTLIQALITAIHKRGPGILGFGGTCPGNTSSNFLRPWNTDATVNTTETKFRVPAACILSALYIQARTGPTGDGITFTVRKNGVDTALVATLAAAGTQAADTTNSVTCAAGDQVSIKAVGGGSISGGAADVLASMKVLLV